MSEREEPHRKGDEREGMEKSWRVIILLLSPKREQRLQLFSLAASAERACAGSFEKKRGREKHRSARREKLEGTKELSQIGRRRRRPFHHAPACCCCWPPAALLLLLLLVTPRADSEQTSRRRRCAWRRSMIFWERRFEPKEKRALDLQKERTSVL